MEIITEYPGYSVILSIGCIGIGAIYAAVLYGREKLLEEVSRTTKWIMAVLRFLAVSLLALFLLGPLLKSETREVEKPVIVLAQDNSSSLLIGKDSAFYRTEYVNQLKALTERLSEKYEVKTYTYGDEVVNGLEVDYTDKRTNISDVFKEIRNRMSNRNLGAIVLATDGIFNTGSNPLYSSSQLNVPVFTIALGDTSVKRDLMVSDIAHNRLAYLGNDFPLEIIVEAKQLQGVSSMLRVSDRSGVLFTQNLTFDTDNYFQVIPVQLEAKRIGLQRFTAEVVPVDGEVSTANNKMDIFIDVLDSRQKVLLLANSPHPDITAFKRAVESNINYEVEVALASEFNGAVDAYSLVVMHQLPSIANPVTDIVQELANKNRPTLFVFGAQTNYNTINQMNIGVQMVGYRGQLSEVTAVHDRNFSLFNINEQLQQQVSKFPPLHTPFGTFKTGNSVVPMLTQKVGMVKTQLPLFVFNKRNDAKIGIITGEGIWRWQIFDYASNKTHKNFNELITKTVQYLAAKEDRSLFRVYCANAFLENEKVIFEAELYNESYELVNDEEVTLKVTNSEGLEFDYSRAKGSFSNIDAGAMAVGEYSYVATVVRDGEKMTEKGEFSVSAIHVESTNTQADHQLLYNLADRSNGQMIFPTQLEELEKLLDTTDQIVPVSYTKTDLSDLLNLWWIFGIIMGLLTLEWFMRKRNGAY